MQEDTKSYHATQQQANQEKGSRTPWQQFSRNYILISKLQSKHYMEMTDFEFSKLII